MNEESPLAWELGKARLLTWPLLRHGAVELSTPGDSPFAEAAEWASASHQESPVPWAGIPPLPVPHLMLRTRISLSAEPGSSLLFSYSAPQLLNYNSCSPGMGASTWMGEAGKAICPVALTSIPFSWFVVFRPQPSWRATFLLPGTTPYRRAKVCGPGCSTPHCPDTGHQVLVAC